MAINPNFSPQNPAPLNRPLSDTRAEAINILRQTENGKEQSERVNTPEAKFSAISVFNNGTHLPVRRGFHHKALRERRMRSMNHKSSQRKSTADESDDETETERLHRSYVSPVDVSMVLSALRDESEDDQRNRVEENLKERKLSPMQRLQIYSKAVESADKAGFSEKDSLRVKQALKKTIGEIQTQNRHELRRAMHDPDKLRHAMAEIAGAAEKLTVASRRELRIYLGVSRPHMESSRVDVPFQALDLLKNAIAVAGAEHCKKALAVFRSMWAVRI